MKQAFAPMLLLLVACTSTPPQAGQAISDWRSGRDDADCEIAGDSSQWRADYCLAAMQTDDVVAAQPCIDHEQQRHHGEECATRRQYKQDWCRLVVRNGSSGQTLAQCIADPEASGAIVKGGQGG
jgi:hypothetical protein